MTVVTKSESVKMVKIDKIIKLQPFDLSYFGDKSHIEDYNTWNYLVFQPVLQIWYKFSKKIYKDLNITTKFHLKPTTEDIALKLLKKFDFSKGAGVDNLPGRF